MASIRMVVLVLALLISGGAHAAKVAVGDTPPDALGRDVQGKDVMISDHLGKVVVVTFWASWCGYCLKEMPVLEGLQQVAGKGRLEVVAVNFKEDRRTYKAILRKLKQVELTMTHDPDGRISDAYGVVVIPYLFLIDKSGKVGYIHSGYSEASLPKLVDAVNGLLRAPVAP